MATGLYDPAYEHDACGVGMVADLHGRADHDIVDRGLTVLERLAHRGASGPRSRRATAPASWCRSRTASWSGGGRAAGFSLPDVGRLRGRPGLPARRRRRRAQGPRRRRAAGRRGGPDGARVARRARPSPTGLGKTALGAMPRSSRCSSRRSTRPRRRHHGARAPRLRAAQAGRARGRRPLLPVAVGPHHRLQGHAHLRAAAPVLPRPARPAVRVGPGPGALPLLDQHLPQLAAGPPVPLPGPQRRDQHAGRQPQLDAGPRGAARDVAHRGGPVAHLPDLHAGGERLGQLRRGARAAASRRALAAARRADDDPRGVGEPHHHGPGAARLLPLPRVADGAVGRPGRGRASPTARSSGAVLDRNGLRPARYWVTDDGLVVLASEVGVLDIAPERVVRKGRLQPGRMFLVDTAKGRLVEDEEIKAELAAEHPYAEWLAAGPDPARRAAGPHHAHAPARRRGHPAAPLRLHDRGAAGDPGADGPHRGRAARLHGLGHRPSPCSRTARGCSTTTSPSSSPR